MALISSLVWTSASASQEQYRDLICSYDWDCNKAMRVAMCESTMNSRAAAHGNYGLFQINSIHGHTIEDLYNPEYNVQVAYNLYLRRGWQPWGYCGRL